VKLDPEDRALLRELVTASKEARDASLQSAAAAELALEQLRTLNEIVAREVSPLGPFRADVIEKLDAMFNRHGSLGLRVGELEEWRDQHAVEHKAAANGR